jgi:hypothetical protein
VRVLESVSNTSRHRLVDVFKKNDSSEYKLWLNSVDFVHFLKLNLQVEVELVSELKSVDLWESGLRAAAVISADQLKFPDVPTAWPTANPSVQTTNTVLMVSPTRFSYNFETAQDNSFMKSLNLTGNYALPIML